MRFNKTFDLSEIRGEFRVWAQLVRPGMDDLPENVVDICQYGFTEVLNNAIDHAAARKVAVSGEVFDDKTVLEVQDDGTGVFASIKNYFDLDSSLHALIDLVKGKVTVAPKFHSGEGLFFASKMFDRFLIESGDLSVLFQDERCMVKTIPDRKGTLARMEIANDSGRSSLDVFARFCDKEEFSFYRTHFTLSLAALEGGLVSRSQAKRVASRLDRFKEVDLDFDGVSMIGQGFADELFRVWPQLHPQTCLKTVNTNDAVYRMISHVQSRDDLPQPEKVTPTGSGNRPDLIDEPNVVDTKRREDGPGPT